jgi:pyruvate kinase
MADLPGPKIRLGELPTEGLRLRPGDRFALTAEASGEAPSATVSYTGLSNDLRSGDRVLLSDGAVELIVRGVEGSDVVTEVVRGGTLRSGAGVNVPAERLGLPAITSRDRAGLSRALDLGIDLVAQSFVRGAADVIGLRALMGEREVAGRRHSSRQSGRTLRSTRSSQMPASVARWLCGGVCAPSRRETRATPTR